MKWIGQHIYDLTSRFRSDVYLEDISTGTIASGAHLGLDSNNKIVKAVDGGGDLTSIVPGTGLSGTSLTGPIPTLNIDDSQTQITGIGTITTGVWNGTAIGGNYIADTQPNIDSIGTDGDTLDILGDTISAINTTTYAPQIKLTNQTDDASAPSITLTNQRVDSSIQDGEDNDFLGFIKFNGYDDGTPSGQTYAQIYATIHDATSGEESGRLSFQVANHDGGSGEGLSLIGGSANNEIDVTVGLGANSVVTIPGDIDLAGDIDVDGTLETDALTIGGAAIAAIGTTAITTLGTIGTGVWQGTTIKTAYIGDAQVTVAKLHADAVQTSGESFAYNDTSLMTSAAIDDAIIKGGSTTFIKVLPYNFMSNEDGGANKSVQFRDDTIIGVRATADNSELYAFVEIPIGKTATTVIVYGNDSGNVVEVFESDINAGALTDKTHASGCVVGTACDITDVAADTTNYLVIKVTITSYTNDIVYGAAVTISG